ncbi:uncharacterized protein M421DRAFT_70201 [Didymella exigua CBS 183.55]|uniref:Glucose receptor Git3-like N-terminal domain-containing protein n=1 Tax=Didymella exigua CBS 183.55 TaxID=1150837 RepID=A0A6A5RDA6_9PLEO|nr:uncharacterized protein M421DRAFT_70201 [Didymella exigua CBS 183.55]KAF1925290.1 hypothetical protein M421DRAFT_70201 [Didymella exigua CBS 183.55]
MATSSSQAVLAWDPASSIPTLTGSLLSLVATTTVILLWIFARGRKRRDFRYALILNLTVAEFLNSLNNSISGSAAVARRRPLLPGTACEVNGWAGQFSVQAVDFSILAITLITLLTIQLRSFVIYASTATKALICLCIWIVPLCTSLFAWRKHYYGPVSGNWCWIEKQYLRQRYTLNHGWRFAIFFISLCTYIYVFVYMSRRLRPQNLSNISCSIPSDVPSFSFARDTPLDTAHNTTPHTAPHTAPDQDPYSTVHPDTPTSPTSTHILVHLEKRPPSLTAIPARPRHDHEIKVDREIWRMLLLNMYPVTYLVLWIPGIANRIAEGMGHNVRALTVLQSSTQFIGLANAGVYVYKEHARDVREWWAGVRGRSGRRGEGEAEGGEGSQA